MRLVGLWGLLVLIPTPATPAEAPDGLLPASMPTITGLPWIEIDTAAKTLVVHSGETAIERLSYIAIGSSGARPVHYQGDSSTPLGNFRVTRINRRSKFHIFIGLDYPTFRHADLALQQKRISLEVYHTILSALRRGRLPPQSTALGGAIGIHGIGSGSLSIHQRANWTQGCVAVTNAEIDRVAGYAWPGMRVDIR